MYIFQQLYIIIKEYTASTVLLATIKQYGDFAEL